MKKYIDYSKDTSLVNKMRQKRFDFFKSFLSSLARPTSILDIGGTIKFWEKSGFYKYEGIHFTIVNPGMKSRSEHNFEVVNGDGTNMPYFRDKQFDIVFSNSVIEHLYSWENQVKMANEVNRLSKSYFVQTPNYGFPVEPHFVFPFFHYLPVPFRIWLTKNYDLGHYPRARNKERAADRVNEIQLLSVKEMKKLFPEAKIYREKLFGLTKSIIAYKFN
ncbi:class I SAM-dependent methyltransferase [Catalinimonas niigatensis]|uniref:class I SAM-dependent methyltransferase n=1 Tax=Catalinimonas niigatensis TaxID=1397264 RepID=UPI0026653429|nr:class I SAM-dependent methyltransferase [Catalinimonas niigatensis]WPP53331.1 class I SAM-dependent methyltransferase [Catalinimonas niigatensis]